MEIVSIIISIIPSIIMLFITRKINAHDREQTAKFTAQSKERLLQLQMTSATLKLSEAVAIAMRDGKTNGEMKAAMSECESAKNAYYEFLNEQAYKHIA